MKSYIQSLKPRIDEVFQHLHHHPEVSWQEVETTRYLTNLLEAEGFRVTPFEGMTGFVVTVGEGSPVVGLRADIDALWQEVDGVFQANHSCGHDAHMTLAVGTLLLLKQLKIPDKGTLKVIFQPAEEKGTGALAVIEQGVIDDIDYLYGVHLRPVDELQDGYYAASLRHGSAKMIRGTIEGTEAHGARPHQGQNSIEVGAALVHALQAIHLDPMVPHSAKMTMFQAGGDSANIIPGTATFSLDLRAQMNEVMEELYRKVKLAIHSVELLHGVKIQFETAAEIVAAEVDPSAEAIMSQAIKETAGEEFVIPTIVSPGGEDFHYFAVKRPSLKTTMLGLGCGLSPGLHHPHMTFNQQSLLTGVEILARAVMLTFDRLEQKEPAQ